ncbi:MAG: PQQ-binding-like beta-propeller repeat protein [Planctomycetes bacterium]|nr:PQQ-binding-like beta-propeller repeat protein [Planctomycetota bacterium]
MQKIRAALAALLLLPVAARQEASSDWPQFMRVPEHRGDAATETLAFPLGLAAQVRLDDAVLSSPAVVGDRAFVVDQMGTAYAIDWRSGRVVWKSAPDGDRAMGSNTSSPCVAQGRVCFGTTAGSFHLLDAATGKVVKSLPLASPVTGSATFANGALYFQTLAAVVHSLDLEGRERWRWDHYKRYVEPKPERFKGYHPGGYDGPHYGGGEVAVSGSRLVTSFGWDHVCIEDKGAEAALVWCNRAALGKDDGIPMQSSIAGDSVYTGWPGVDAAGTLLRVSLADGSFDPKKDQLGRDRWAVFGTPAARGNTAYFGRHIRGLGAHEYGKGTLWESYRWTDPDGYTPTAGSPALSKDHCVFTTLKGELIAVPLNAQGSGLDKIKAASFRFKVPGGKPISSSPAVSKGHVFFGCDDGCLYVLGPEGKLAPEEAPSIAGRKSKTTSGTSARYAWPSPYGTPANANFVEDPGLKPPFRLRWAARSHGVFVQPLSATDEDLVGVTLEGTALCLEQQTGRLRWRRRLPGEDAHGTTGVLCDGGRAYVVRPASKKGALYCLDLSDGRTIWTAPIGSAQWYARGAPVMVDGIVAFGHVKGEASVVEAWEAATGKPAWELKLEDAKWEGHGCALDGVMIFSGGSRPDSKGETVALEGRTGKLLWRSTEAHCGYRGTPSARDGRVYLSGWDLPARCVSIADGKVLWTTEQKFTWGHVPALGSDFFCGRGYSGRSEAWRLEDGKAKKANGKQIPLGAPDHACGPVLLTSGGLSLAVTVSGLYARDVSTGEMLWNSPGFAPRSCSSPIAANGRVFYNPQVNGMLYCFEPEK